MAQVTITINSREYGIACGDGQEAHIIKLSRLLDEKAKLLTAGNGQINENMLLAMIGLLLADELEDQDNEDEIILLQDGAVDLDEVATTAFVLAMDTKNLCSDD